jgi:hypothetical protein
MDRTASSGSAKVFDPVSKQYFVSVDFLRPVPDRLAGSEELAGAATGSTQEQVLAKCQSPSKCYRQ